jgi:hypothetical protein
VGAVPLLLLLLLLPLLLAAVASAVASATAAACAKQPAIESCWACRGVAPAVVIYWA